MKQHGVVLAIGMMLLLGIVGLGCDEKTEKIKEQERQIEEQERQIEEQKRQIEEQKEQIKDQGERIAVLWVIIPLAVVLTLFAGTAMGLKGKKDSKPIRGAKK